MTETSSTIVRLAPLPVLDALDRLPAEEPWVIDDPTGARASLPELAETHLKQHDRRRFLNVVSAA